MNTTAEKLTQAILNTRSPHIRMAFADSSSPILSAPVDVIVSTIEEAFILIPRDELPPVPANAVNLSAVTVGPYCFSGARDKDPALIRGDLLAVAAWFDHLERHQAAEKAAEAKLAKRRDALVSDIVGHPWTYGPDVTEGMRRAVDRIIELEGNAP